MIAQLKGILVEIHPTHLVVECNGVGYELSISLASYTHYQNQKDILIYSKLVVREDAHLLFGFYSKQEREMFNLLISVNGVGPASAMMMLSTLNLDEIAGAIGSGNSALLQKVKGIGMKSAQRIIIDLRDKMSIFVGSGEISLNQNNKIKNETLNALEVLGVPKKIAERHIDLLLKENPDSSVEELIKNILKKL